MEEAKRLKIDTLLAKQLGIDPPGDVIPVIVEYHQRPTSASLSALSAVGARITGASNVLPMVYAEMTKEQILAIQARPDVKRVYFSPRVKALR